MPNTSQYQVEDYIRKYIPRPGFFLEIGCWDGERLSQTAALEREGWTGVCVDPFPINFERRKSRLCNTAVSQDGKPREFVHVTVDRRHGNDVSYFSGFKNSIHCHWPLISEHCCYTTKWVPTITIDDLYLYFEIPDYVEFLSIDTEGSEVEILQSIDLTKRHYGIIDLEHNGSEQVRGEFLKLLAPHGYKLLERLSINDIYKHESLQS